MAKIDCNTMINVKHFYDQKNNESNIFMFLLPLSLRY